MLKSNVCTLLNNTWCATLPTIGVEVNCWWGGAFYVARWTKQSPGAKIHNGPSPPLFLPPTHPQKIWKSITAWALCDLLPQLILNSRKGLCACIYICHKILPFLPGAKFSNILLLLITHYFYNILPYTLSCFIMLVTITWRSFFALPNNRSTK